MPYYSGYTLIRGDDLRRFWSKTKRKGKCIIWTGDVTKHFGHGKFSTGGPSTGGQKMHKAHRWIYEQLVGPIRSPVLRHSCDNPACVNIKHLIPGTQLDNVHDAMKRGRRPSVGLTTVKKIRRAYASGESLTAIANRLQRPVTTVFMIAHRRVWKHV